MLYWMLLDVKTINGVLFVGSVVHKPLGSFKPSVCSVSQATQSIITETNANRPKAPSCNVCSEKI